MVRICVVFIAFCLFFAQAAQACETEEACLQAYAEAVLDRDTPIDMPAAEQALRAGCAINTTGKSCRLVSLMIDREMVAGTPEEAAGFLLAGCQAGDDRACNALSERFMTSSSWEQPRELAYRTAREAVEADCSDGNDYACRKLVRYVSEEDIARYAPRCDAGERVFCALIGGSFIYPYYDAVEQAWQGEDIFRAQCEAGEGMGCMFLGDFLETGHSRDLNEAHEPHMRRACALGVAHGCNMAHAYMLAANPDATRGERLSLMEPSCDAGYELACVRAAWVWSDVSERRMLQYGQALTAECLNGSPRMCHQAADLYANYADQAKLSETYADVDRHLQNHFDFAAMLSRR